MGRKLVVGLGNPGPEYEQTWHNLGFRIVRHLARRLKTSLRQRDVVLYGKARFAGHEVNLILPQEYMNLSGRAVRRWADRLHVEDEDILVVFDDHDLPRGMMRMRAAGGDGGHRGLRSVLREMGTPAISRLRVGIRDDVSDPDVGGYEDLADRVLESLTAEETEQMELMAAGASQAVTDWLVGGIRMAMNRNNGKHLLPIDKQDSEENKQQ